MACLQKLDAGHDLTRWKAVSKAEMVGGEVQRLISDRRKHMVGIDVLLHIINEGPLNSHIHIESSGGVGFSLQVFVP